MSSDFVDVVSDPPKGIPIVEEDSGGPLWKRKLAERRAVATTSARVVHDSGKGARIRTGDRESFVKEGDLIPCGSTVYANDSRIALELGENGPRVILHDGTELHLERIEIDNTGLEKVFAICLDVRGGWLGGPLRRLSAGSELIIRTAETVVIPHGDFEVSASGNTFAKDGWLEVITDKEYYRLEAGQTFPAASRK